MKVLITGANGQLGSDLVKVIMKSGHEVIATDMNDMDITNAEAVMDYIVNSMPQVVIHAAAYTQVDRAESDEAKCYEVNVIGTKNVVSAVKAVGSKLLYISTDYVFDGTKQGEYFPNDIPNPISVYGKTKYLGELEVGNYSKSFIVRISWVFGMNGQNFVKTIKRLSEQLDSINVVSDQIGSPTYTMDLSKLVLQMIQTDKYGIYHATNEGFCSWYDFSLEIIKKINKNTSVVPISSNEYNTAAKRPTNSKLSKQCLEDNGFQRLRHWKSALNEFLKELERII